MKRATAGRAKDASRAGGPGLAQTGHEARTLGGGAEPTQAQPSPEAAAPEYAADAYVVTLPTFEGPLDLLLSIIQKHELDILDIPIGFITEKYLTYLKLMQTLTIDVASEYLVMAATLALIKSKSLLPDAPSDGSDESGDEEEEDPRAELVRRLLEYQKYKAAAEDLGARDTLGSAVFPRGHVEERPEGPAPFAGFNVVDLFDAFSKVLARTGTKVEHEVVFDRISITDRIVELTDLLKSRGSVPFEEIFVRENRAPAKFDVVITFLAVLEMCRLRMMRVYQTEALAPIHVDLIVLDEGAPLDMREELADPFKAEPARAEPPPSEPELEAEVAEPPPAEPELEAEVAEPPPAEPELEAAPAEPPPSEPELEAEVAPSSADLPAPAPDREEPEEPIR